MKNKTIPLILVTIGLLLSNPADARRVHQCDILQQQEPVHQFLEGEPTKQLAIGIDFIGTIALGSEGQAREGMLDFLRELKTRGHKVLLFTGTSYEECIKEIPELENIIDGYRDKSDRSAISKFDFIIDDDAALMTSVKLVFEARGGNPDNCIIIPAPRSYDYKNNPFGWTNEIVELIQRAGG